MRVFLLVPRCLNPKQTYREYPLGVGLIATALRRRGHEVALYDQPAEGADDGPLWAKMRGFAPDVVGFSVITPSYPVAQQQIQQVQRELPGALIVAGGIHPSLFAEDLLADGADVVVIGEGAESMSTLLDRVEGRRSWHDLPGLAYREATAAGDRVVRTAGNAQRDTAEDPGIIDRSVYNLPLYTHHSMMASLGCPYRCAFCCNYAGTVLQKGVTVRSHECILEEMRYLAEQFAARQVFFVDDVFLLSRRNALEFCRRLEQERLGLEWIAQMRVDTIDADVATAMATANCRRVYFGVESGSEAVLRRCRKGIDKEAVRLAVRSAKQAGLRVKTGWIFGLPGTLDEQYESIGFMRELRPHEISIHQLIPFPGTEYYDRAAEHRIRIRDPKDFASFCYGGLGKNITFDYLSEGELVALFEEAAAVLESEGYVHSDRAGPQDEYVYSTPLSATSMNVFRTQDQSVG
jgi:radical SAM superfamily enzyme YgiQ (UPF0313 family)